jgi:hypothetical protein
MPQTMWNSRMNPTLNTNIDKKLMQVIVNPPRTDVAVSLFSKTTTLKLSGSAGVPIRILVSSGPIFLL